MKKLFLSLLLICLNASAYGACPGTLNDGVLDKTIYGYLVREAGDLSGMPDYSADDFTIEVALDWDGYNFLGDFGEIFRHATYGNQYSSSSPGWSIGVQNQGYNTNPTKPISVSLADGSTLVSVGGVSQHGKMHIVAVFDQATSTLSLYINGEFVESEQNISLSMPPTLTSDSDLVIGGNNKADSPATINNDNAWPDLTIHFARVWEDGLTSTEVSTIYDNWVATGESRSPSAITKTISVEYLMNGEYGDKDGNAGTGWLADCQGGNHLQISSSPYVSGPESSIWTPSGTIRGTSPSDAVTGVSGAVTLEADGQIGTKGPMHYSFEVDEANTFNTSELKRSGYVLGWGKWQPKLKPLTTYYWRVKVKDSSATPTESSWSSTYSFTTRAATDWFVRAKTTPGTYGDEDGTSYVNAWNDMRWNGVKGGIDLDEVAVQADLDQVAPGDSIYICGDWGLMSDSTWSLDSTSPQTRTIRAVGHSSDHPVYVRGDHPSYPYRHYKVFRLTTAPNWVDEGGGIWSDDESDYEHFDVRYVLDDGNGVPNIVMSDPLSNTGLYNDETQTLASAGWYKLDGTMYVRLPDDSSPTNRLWMLGGNATYGLSIVNSKYLHFKGGELYGGSVNGCVEDAESTYVVMEGTKWKFISAKAALGFNNYCDNWILDNIEMSYTLNGIYGWNTPLREPATRRTADYITLKNSYIHHIGEYGWYHKDSHAIGWQSGNDWIIENNVFHNTGTAVENWTSDYKPSINHKIRDNEIYDITARLITFGGGVAITTAADLGNRTGIEITNNTIYNTDGSGIHVSVNDPIVITHNTVINSGLNPDPDKDYAWDGISLRNASTSLPANPTITYNTVVNPRARFINIAGLAGSIDGVSSSTVINYNAYWYDLPADADTGNLFRANILVGSTTHSFNSWVANTPFDQNSVWSEQAPVSTAETRFVSDGILLFNQLSGQVNFNQ